MKRFLTFLLLAAASLVCAQQIPPSTAGYSLNQAKIKLGQRVPSKYFLGLTNPANYYTDTIFAAPPVATSPQNYAWCLDVLSYRMAHNPLNRQAHYFIAGTTISSSSPTTAKRRDSAATAAADTDDGLDDLGFNLSSGTSTWDGASKINSPSGTYSVYAGVAVLGQDLIYLKTGVPAGWYTVVGVDPSANHQWIQINPVGQAIGGAATNAALTVAGTGVTSSTGPWITTYKAQSTLEANTNYATFTAASGNTGNGTCGSITTTVATLSGPLPFTFTCTNAGTQLFSVVGPSGQTLSNLTVGTPYSAGGLSFTITAGGTPYVLGDSFTIATGIDFNFRRGSYWQYLLQGTTTSLSVGSNTVTWTLTSLPTGVTVASNALVGATVLVDTLANYPTPEFCVITANGASSGSTVSITMTCQNTHSNGVNVSQTAFVVDHSNITLKSCGPGTIRPRLTRFANPYAAGSWTQQTTTCTSTSAASATLTVANSTAFNVGDIVVDATNAFATNPVVVSSIPNATTIVLNAAVSATSADVINDSTLIGGAVTTATAGSTGATLTVANSGKFAVNDTVTDGTTAFSGGPFTVSSIPNATTIVLAGTGVASITTTSGDVIKDTSALGRSPGAYSIADSGLIGWVRYQSDIPNEHSQIFRKVTSIANTQQANAYGTWFSDGVHLSIQPPYVGSVNAPTNGRKLEVAYATQADGIEVMDVDGTRIRGLWVEGFGLPSTNTGAQLYTGYDIRGAVCEDRELLIDDNWLYYANRHVAGDLTGNAPLGPGLATGNQAGTAGGGIFVAVGNECGLGFEGPDMVSYAGTGRNEFVRAWNLTRFGALPGGTANAALGTWYTDGGLGSASISHTSALQEPVLASSTSSVSPGSATITVVNPGQQYPVGSSSVVSTGGYAMIDEGANREWVIPSALTYNANGTQSVTATFAKSHSGTYYLGTCLSLFIDIGTTVEAGQYQALSGATCQQCPPFGDLVDCRSFIYNQTFNSRLRTPADYLWPAVNGTNAHLGAVDPNNCVVANSTYNNTIVSTPTPNPNSAGPDQDVYAMSSAISNTIYLNTDFNITFQQPVPGPSGSTRYRGIMNPLGPYYWQQTWDHCNINLRVPGFAKMLLAKETGSTSFSVTNIVAGSPYIITVPNFFPLPGDQVSITGNANATYGTLYTISCPTQTTITTGNSSKGTTINVASSAGFNTGDAVYLAAEGVNATVSSTGAGTITLSGGSASTFSSAGEAVYDLTQLGLVGDVTGSGTAAGGTLQAVHNKAKILNSIVQLQGNIVDGGGNPINSYPSLGNVSSIMANNAYFGGTTTSKFDLVTGYSNDPSLLDLTGPIALGYRPYAGDQLLAPIASEQALSFTWNGVTNTYTLGYDKGMNLRGIALVARGPWEFLP